MERKFTKIIDLMEILENENYIAFREAMIAKLDEAIEEKAWKEFEKHEKLIKSKLYINKKK